MLLARLLDFAPSFVGLGFSVARLGLSFLELARVLVLLLLYFGLGVCRLATLFLELGLALLCRCDVLLCLADRFVVGLGFCLLVGI